MNLHASIRGLALAVGGLLVLAGVALATGGNGADDASASSPSISPSPSAFETAGGALNSPEPTASPENGDDDASPAESPAASLRRRRVPGRLSGRRGSSGSIPGRVPAAYGRWTVRRRRRHPMMTRSMPTTTPGPVAGTTTIPARAATTTP